MNIRGEKNASAFITLKNGSWKYKDFGGTGSSGNIINVVMDATGKGYKDALNYALQELNIPNYLTEALETPQIKYTLSEEEKKKIEERKKYNKLKEKSCAISTIKTVYDISTNKNAIDFLKSRGIEKIPPHFKLISGEYLSSKDNKKKRAFGVGVLTENKNGADIHFLKKIGNLKSMNFGEKKVSFFPNETSKKIAVFESKMDYAAVYQQIPLNKVNVVIANATSMYKRVAEIIKEKNYETVMFFNQNDLPGCNFVLDIITLAELKDYKLIDYNILDEYKKDNNDLLLDGVSFKERIIDGNEELIQNIIEELKKIKELKNNLELLKEKKQESTIVDNRTLKSSIELENEAEMVF
jgi:hypothetical protein